MNLGTVRWMLFWCLLAVVPGLRAAVFDFTPNDGVVTATYVGGASGYVQMTISGLYQTNVTTGSTQSPLINNGVIAWASSSAVYYYAFDPVRTNWSGGVVAASSVQDLKVVDGVVSWSVTSGGTLGAFMRAYDPLRQSWRDATEAGTIQSPGVFNQGGVVAGIRANPSGGKTVFYYTYDPLRTGWIRGSTDIAVDTFDFTMGDGLLAWSHNLQNGQYRVNFRIYDPQGSGGWKASQSDGGFVTDLAIANSQVTWKAGGNNAFSGYNGAGGWGLQPVTVPYFVVSTNAGNATFNVVFIDMSLGANSWTWNFGDASGVSNRRSPVHPYVSYGRFNATLTAVNTVFGGTGNATRTIVTDTILPAGTLKINGTTSGGFTTNRNVTLTLTVSDNSLNGLALRVSNEGTNWSDWLSFNGLTNATVNWALPTNVGTRSVSAQFRDGALNTSSPPVTASIQLDTTPIPTATLNSTNLDEGVEILGPVQFAVVLDHTYSRTVAISYAATNGTAVAGNDFALQPGTLIYAPGERTKFIPLSIINDGNVELNETFTIHLSAVSNVVVGAAATVTILDNDPALVSFAQTNYAVLENDTNGAVVMLRLSAPSGRLVTLGYVATNGTATPNVDFTPKQGTVVFQPGQTESGFVIPLNNDTLDEYPEVINLRILGATNAILSGVADAIVTIIDDDLPLVSFTRAVIPALEPSGASGFGPVQAEVRLSKPFTNIVTARVAVEGVTATPFQDYSPPSTDVLLTYNPGDTNAVITLGLAADTTRELQEVIRLRLVSFFNASPGGILSADIVITDEDAPPFMSGPVVSTNGQFTATFTGYPGQVFAVECSPNFTAWTEIVRLTNTTGTLVFSQNFSTNALGQFYRTRLIP